MQSIPRVAVIGAGNIGRLHVRILSRLRALVGIADTHPAIQEMADQRGVPFFDNYEKMINAINPDGVVIATPTDTHFSIAKHILTKFPSIRGILIEKPLTSTSEQAKELESLTKDHPAKILVGHVERYNPVIDRMLRLLEDNTIGEMRTIIIQRRGAVPEKRIPSVGDVFVDIGVHDFDVFSCLAQGDFGMRVVGVSRNGETCNAATIVLSKEDGFQCTIHLSREYAGRKRTIEIEGTGGTMIVDLVAQIIELRSLGVARGEERATVTPFREGERMKLYGEPLQEELMDFLDCLLTSKEPKVSLDAGIAAIKLVESARLSKKTGKVVQISL
jgi:predicted dehydrogenase